MVCIFMLFGHFTFVSLCSFTGCQEGDERGDMVLDGCGREDNWPLFPHTDKPIKWKLSPCYIVSFCIIAIFTISLLCCHILPLSVFTIVIFCYCTMLHGYSSLCICMHYVCIVISSHLFPTLSTIYHLSLYLLPLFDIAILLFLLQFVTQF